MTIQEIKDAVDAGKHVFWSHTGYAVIKDSLGEYLIHSIDNDHYIGLTNKAGNQLNGKEEDFFLKCKCSEDYCECWSVRMSTDEIPHCFKCPESKKLIGGGLECYGTFDWTEQPHIYDCSYGQPDGLDDFIKDCECD